LGLESSKLGLPELLIPYISARASANKKVQVKIQKQKEDKKHLHSAFISNC
jgi:hypothetical protein